MKDTFLPPFQQDVEHIIHSKAFSRYTDKTQVVYLVDNDHVTHRALHVQLVSFYARSLAKKLSLNVDLVEAISLGHDMGHPPFGHEGEGYLSKITESLGLGAFSHARQSCRLVSSIEPLNLSFQVLDGFLCHDGGMKDRIVRPNSAKTFEDHLHERDMRLKDPEINLEPATQEAALVKMCDTISYLARDLEDAISLGIVKREEVPKTLLGKTNREILHTAGLDLVQQSLGNSHIAISQDVHQSLKVLRKFNFDRFYMHPSIKTESKKIQESYELLFETLLKDYKQKLEKSFLHSHFLHSRTPEYLEVEKNEQKVVDFIAGMTDRYFIATLQNLIVPQKIELCIT